MRRHTRGPWAQLNYCVYAQEPNSEGIYKLKVAETSFEENDLSHEECDANARLIASAPELIDWLKTARESLCAKTCQTKRIGGMVLLEHWYDCNKISELITRVEGK